MFKALKKGMFALALQPIKDYVCPQCGFAFAPLQEREITSWADKITCPKCGHEDSLKDALKSQGEVKVNPPGPFAQPPECRIERKPVSSTELLFYIPASGKSGALLFMAIFWNALSWTVFLTFLLASHKEPNGWKIIPFVALFPLIGIGLAYAALRTRYAIHLLYLSADRIRLQRQFFGRRKNFDLTTTHVKSVRKVEFYQQNYQPVYGIEIKSPEGKIRFGSILTDDEKNWLCWEIREFVARFRSS